MSQTGVTLRTTRDRLLIFLGDDVDFGALMDRLRTDLRETDARAGCREAMVDVGKRVMSQDQLRQLEIVVEQQGGLKLTRVVDSIDMASRPSWWPSASDWPGATDDETSDAQQVTGGPAAGPQYTVVHAPDPEPARAQFSETIWRRAVELPEGPGRKSTVVQPNAYLHKATLRSGQTIEFDGDVIVLGDVNPGAEVISSGDVVVMGTLRGVAHAGSGGDHGATVSAFRLQPTQLRISDLVARSPDGERPRPRRPEIARIQQGAVIIESLERLLPSKRKGGNPR